MKSIFTSKTFWANVVALGAMLLQGATGNEVLMPAEAQASVLAVVNILLRSVTAEAVSWK